jgi:ADP-heptose:LPS heptosyltransferase
MGRPLDESLDLMAYSSLHLGVDTWSNHATNICWADIGFVPSIILFGSTQASASGYARNANLSLKLPCQPCFREDPKISASPRGPCVNPPGQVYEDPHHACMDGIETGWVLETIKRLWGRGQNGPSADHRGESGPMGEGDSTGG